MKTKETQPARQPFAFAALSKAAASIALAFALIAGGANAQGKSPRAAASIAPLHSLLAAVAGGDPLLLIEPGRTPHRVRLTPSQVSALHKADAFFYIGGIGAEGFSAQMLGALKGKKVAFTDTIKTLPYREPNYLTRRGKDKHGHDDDHHDEHDHDEHDDHDKHDRHDDHDDHGHDKKHGKHDDDDHRDHNGHDKHDDHDDHGGHDDHHDHDHGHGQFDVHLWLDINRARQMVKQMADILGAVDPAQRETYRQNAARTDAKLAALDAEIAAILADAKGKPFVVAHDAYQYFERRYGLAQPVALRGGEAGGLSAKRLRAARRAMREQGIRCVFREPQIPARHLQALAEDNNATIAVADPLGANIPAGEEHYFMMMRQLAKSFANCLAG